MMEAIRSHFPTPGDGAIGALDMPEDVRRRLAREPDSLFSCLFYFTSTMAKAMKAMKAKAAAPVKGAAMKAMKAKAAAPVKGAAMKAMKAKAAAPVKGAAM